MFPVLLLKFFKSPPLLLVFVIILPWTCSRYIVCANVFFFCVFFVKSIELLFANSNWYFVYASFHPVWSDLRSAKVHGQSVQRRSFHNYVEYSICCRCKLCSMFFSIGFFFHLITDVLSTSQFAPFNHQLTTRLHPHKAAFRDYCKQQTHNKLLVQGSKEITRKKNNKLLIIAHPRSMDQCFIFM